jgi:hypothetical protein
MRMSFCKMNPVSQMQQLVSHWNTLMPKTTSKKRRRDDSDESMTNTKAKTLAPSPIASQTAPTPGTPSNNAPAGFSS